MRRAKLMAWGLAAVIGLLMATLPAAAKTGPATRRGQTLAQTAPTTVPTAAISLSPTADLSSAAPVDTAETPGELLAAYIVFAVVGIVVLVTVYLVWRTRPKR